MTRDTDENQRAHELFQALEADGPNDTVARHDPAWPSELQEMAAHARAMRRAPHPQAPAGLADRVMRRLPSGRPSPLAQMAGAFSRALAGDYLATRLIRGRVSTARCAFYFFAAALGHALVGGLMLSMATDPLLTAQIPAWVAHQPHVAFTSAALFAALGLMFLYKGRPFTRMALLGVLAYMGFALVNGAALQLLLGIPPALPATLGLVGMGVSVSLFLASVLFNYMEERNGQSCSNT